MIYILKLLKLKFVVALYLLVSVNGSFAETFLACELSRIVDGDTIYCISSDSEELKIRLIGIDAPESIITQKAYKDLEKTGDSIETIQKMGEQAKRFVESKLKPGSEIRLEFDVQKKDRYGRTLAYIYLSDGTMLNELIVREECAQVSTYPPNVKYEKRFLKAQQEARENKRGFWE